jgi:glycosyltransferase involved in cell wall biosynthesis
MTETPNHSAPRITVIVPAYGLAHLVGEALDSLLAQDMADWEAIVIDDGSPDNVAAAVAPYLDDDRIRFLATDNAGVSGARNRAIALAKAPLIALLDADDRLRSGYVRMMAAVLHADPHAVIATCNAQLFGAVSGANFVVAPDQNRHGTGNLADVLAGRFNIYIGSTFRRQAFEAIGGFDKVMTHGEDLDLWVRLLMHGGHARHVDAVLGDYRVRSDSASTHALKMIRGRIRIFESIIAARPGSPEALTAATMRDAALKDAEVEEAIAATIAGETDTGIAILRRHRSRVNGPVWTLAFALWRVFPQAAPPMLAWRRRRHARTLGTNALYDTASPPG